MPNIACIGTGEFGQCWELPFDEWHKRKVLIQRWYVSWQVLLNALKGHNKCIRLFWPNSLPAFTELKHSCLRLNNMLFKITKEFPRHMDKYQRIHKYPFGMNIYVHGSGERIHSNHQKLTFPKVKVIVKAPW